LGRHIDQSVTLTVEEDIIGAVEIKAKEVLGNVGYEKGVEEDTNLREINFDGLPSKNFARGTIRGLEDVSTRKWA
jgi:hypothetical protein